MDPAASAQQQQQQQLDPVAAAELLMGVTGNLNPSQISRLLGGMDATAFLSSLTQGGGGGNGDSSGMQDLQNLLAMTVSGGMGGHEMGRDGGGGSEMGDGDGGGGGGGDDDGGMMDTGDDTVKGPWTTEEDERLTYLVSRQGSRLQDSL